MNNTTYEKLRRAVYAIIYPDGIPLEFGCEVLINTTLCPNCTENECFDFCDSPEECNQTFLKDLSEGDLQSDIVVDTGDASYTTETSEHRCLQDYEFKILGKDLELSDILIAIQKNTQSDKKDCVNYHTNKYMNISLSLDDVEAGTGFIDIDLTKPIKEQDEPTLEQLLQLITK